MQPMAKSAPTFQQTQYEFAAHIRNPDKHDRPRDVEDRRMAIYRDLFYNNVESFLSNGFPVLRTLYADADWHRMAREFFSNHRCHTPYFLEISQEFLKYLQEGRKPQPEDPPFLSELAHYEWVELALSICEQEPDWEQIDREGDLLEGRPALSPLAWLLSYQFAVHRISTAFMPDTPSEAPTYLMVYRDREDKVGFMEVNPVTARLVALIAEQPEQTGRQLLEQIAQELRHPQPEVVVQGGKQILSQLYGSHIILGSYK